MKYFIFCFNTSLLWICWSTLSLLGLIIRVWSLKFHEIRQKKHVSARANQVGQRFDNEVLKYLCASIAFSAESWVKQCLLQIVWIAIKSNSYNQNSCVALFQCISLCWLIKILEMLKWCQILQLNAIFDTFDSVMVEG